MRYFFDFEFNGFGGDLISLGIAAEDGFTLYLVEKWERLNWLRSSHRIDPWVEANVLPILMDNPPDSEAIERPVSEWGEIVANFYEGDDKPHFFCDWPSDIADLCKIMITGPGTAVQMPHQTIFTCLRHLDVYPTSLPGAVQHHALWDALALKRWVEEQEA